MSSEQNQGRESRVVVIQGKAVLFSDKRGKTKAVGRVKMREQEVKGVSAHKRVGTHLLGAGESWTAKEMRGIPI